MKNPRNLVITVFLVVFFVSTISIASIIKSAQNSSFESFAEGYECHAQGNDHTHPAKNDASGFHPFTSLDCHLKKPLLRASFKNRGPDASLAETQGLCLTISQHCEFDLFQPRSAQHFVSDQAQSIDVGCDSHPLYLEHHVAPDKDTPILYFNGNRAGPQPDIIRR